MSDYRKVLKIKRYADSIQYTYTDLQKNRKFSSFRKNTNKSTKDEVERCSISRSISIIKELCFCNNFDYFVTLTLKNKKRCNVYWATSYLNRKIKEYGKSRGNFKYLYVFEKQEKGGIHIHGFFSGFDDLYKNKYGHLSSRFFDKVGFQNFTDVDKVNPFYLIKYISKKPIRELKHRYFRSKNLKKAEVSYLHCNFDEFANFGFTFKSQWGKMITIAI